LAKKLYSIISCDKTKFAWFKIPKTGTLSFSTILDKHLNLDRGVFRPTIVDNVDIEDLHSYSETYDDYFKFTFVRNPWDRLFSCYLDKVVNTINTSREIICYKKYNGMSFSDFVFSISAQDLTSCSIHHRLQTSLFPADKIDFVGKFENLQEDFTYVLNKIGLNSFKIPHKNKTSHKNYSLYYDLKSRDIVSDLYKKDIDLLKYQF
tara:strand:- start:169 stop:786 length:618 start_codon:yes stop_codon:yes gene_type:complete